MNEQAAIRVLLADDDEEVLECYRCMPGELTPGRDTGNFRALEEELFGATWVRSTAGDINIVTCRQGDEAVRLVWEAIDKANPFDVVVLDIRMPPGINGVEAARQIRSFDERVQIIFVSGNSDFRREELIGYLPPAECLHYLSKPVRLAELKSTIRDVAA